MPAPTFQAVGTHVSENGITNVTVGWPTHAVDDVAILWVHTVSFVSGAAAAQPTLGTPAGFTLGDSVLSSAPGSGVWVRATWFWARATSTSMASPVVTAQASRQNGIITTYRGCIATGTPWDVKSVGANDAFNTSISIAGATSTVADCLVAIGLCSNGSSHTFGSWTNADLSSLTESSDSAVSVQTMATAYGGKATAGAYGATTATASANSCTAGAAVALKPLAGGGATGNLLLLGVG